MPRYASIWFPYLITEYTVRKQPALRGQAFVVSGRKNGRMLVESVSETAAKNTIRIGMAVADCKAIFPELLVLESEPKQNEKLLKALAEWCIGYTPSVALDFPDGLLLDTTGCTHLWGNELAYIEAIKTKLAAFGYTAYIAIADTIGMAWGAARYTKTPTVIPAGAQREALQKLPAAALRVDTAIVSKLQKLGLQQVESFINIPRDSLRRRFGPELSLKIDQALGYEREEIIPVKPIEPYSERFPCLEPIPTLSGITIALQQLLERLCFRLEIESIGLREAVFTACRIDGDVQKIKIGTVHPSLDSNHILKLFETKISTLEPALGFELFILEALKTEAVTHEQMAIWNASVHNDKKISELLDRVSVRIGANSISRYLPSEHYWPERSVKKAMPLWEKPDTDWPTNLPRPIHLLEIPEAVEVTAVLPDYPPMLFRYKGKAHTVSKSDGPERIEQEWWLNDGLYRDYYCVEDENGSRYWLFRSGPYAAGPPKWFIHGFFA